MLKTLIKKQFIELFNLYFRSGRKTKRSFVGHKFTFFIIALIAILIMFAFFGIAELFGTQLYNTPNCWFFFVVFGGISVIVSVFVNMFISSSMLYKAKDNFLLLSLPIAPKIMLLSRMTTLYFNCWIFTTLVWLPISISYFLSVSAPILSVINIVIMLFLLPCFALVVSSILGFFVSLITMKKGIARLLGLLLMAVFIIGYIFIRFSFNTGINLFSENMDQIVASVESCGIITKAIGLAASGDVIAMLVVLVVVIVAFAIMYVVMSLTFINMITSNKGTKQVTYKKKDSKKKSINSSLLKKEFLLLWGTSEYMMNCALGVPIMLIGIVVAIWQSSYLKQFIPLFESVPVFSNALPICVVAIICFVASLNVISTPSVSVEGRKNIWILQSLPLDPYQVLRAKTVLHIVVNLIPAFILAIVSGFILELNPVNIIMICALISCYILLTGVFGTFLSIKKADLDWFNIILPVRQSTNILLSIVFGFFLNIVVCLPGLFIDSYIYIPIACALMLLLSLLINKWLKNKGSKIFRNL